MPSPDDPGFIPPHGNYEALHCYQKAEAVYDITFRFCHKELSPGDRTRDQMIQAARSGKQNILEGSLASGTSKEMEVKLTNVARASLGEWLADYQDYLRVRDMGQWEKDSKEALYVRKMGHGERVSYETYRKICETRPSSVIANLTICLIHQTNYLLNQLIRRLEQDFLREGGLRERMTRARTQSRKRPPDEKP